MSRTARPAEAGSAVPPARPSWAWTRWNRPASGRFPERSVPGTGPARNRRLSRRRVRGRGAGRGGASGRSGLRWIRSPRRARAPARTGSAPRRRARGGPRRTAGGSGTAGCRLSPARFPAGPTGLHGSRSTSPVIDIGEAGAAASLAALGRGIEVLPAGGVEHALVGAAGERDGLAVARLHGYAETGRHVRLAHVRRPVRARGRRRPPHRRWRGGRTSPEARPAAWE